MFKMPQLHIYASSITTEQVDLFMSKEYPLQWSCDSFCILTPFTSYMYILMKIAGFITCPIKYEKVMILLW